MKKGITLIELLIVMVIFGILMTAFTSIYLSGIKTFRRELSKTQLQSETQTVLDRILTDIKKSRTVLANIDDKNLGDQTLILSTPSINSEGNFIYTNSNIPLLDTIIYYRQGNTLKRKVISDSQSTRFQENNIEKILTTNVDDINFTYTYPIGSVNPTQIKVTLSFSKKIGDIIQKITVSGTASLRNLP